jgi:septal ring factor EnvC (AmiA/AmiB activator)
MKPLALTATFVAAICLGLLAAGTPVGVLPAPGLPAFGPSPAWAESLREQKDDAAARVDSLSEQLTSDRAGFDQASAEAEAAAARESELSGQIAEGEARTAQLRRQLEVEEAELERARDRYRRAQGLLASRLAQIYMAGTPDTTDILFGSDDFSDLATQAEYVASIRSADQRLAERVREVRSSLVASVERIDGLKDQAEAQVAALDAARSSIASARAAAEASAAEFAALAESRQSEISQLRSDIDSWEKEIQRREAVSEAEAEEEVAAELGGPYAIPTYIVMCESGGNYSALNPSSGAGGAYQIIPSTWEAYGGEGLPHEASKAEQDRIAALIYADSGTAPWVCG